MATLSEALIVARQHHRAGRLEAAAQLYRRILDAAPDEPDALHLLGLVLHAQGDSAAAVELIRRALALDPPAATVYATNLAVVYRAQDNLPAAIAAYRDALRRSPEHVPAQDGLARTLHAAGQLAAAVQEYSRLLELTPTAAEAWNSYGLCLQDTGRSAEAIHCYRQALHLDPALFAAGNNLGNALQESGRLAEALTAYRQALAWRPDSADVYCNLGNTLLMAGDVDAAATSFERAMALDPADATAHSSRLLTMQYQPGVTAAELATAHREFERRHAARLLPANRAKFVRGASGAPLRLGFVSPNLCQHAVGSFLVGVLEHLEPAAAQTICYSDIAGGDQLTARLQRAAAAWHTVAGWSDARLAQQIQSDQIDVLFDLAGHTGRNRLLVFARRPAPVQITWMGYPGTTGLSALDFILADTAQIPPGEEDCYCERVLRLPGGYVCYDPPSYAPDVGPPPADGAGHITFGSFSNLAKITPPVVAAWAEILRRVPGSRLLVKYWGLDDAATRARYAALFAQHGIAAERLMLERVAPHAALLACYNRVDLALGTFPYSGGLTTCEALWMGVPVVTFPGATFAGRHACSHLRHLGFTETIAADLAGYIARAVELASDRSRLAELRKNLRPRMAAAPLCDGRRFAGELVAALRSIKYE